MNAKSLIHVKSANREGKQVGICSLVELVLAGGVGAGLWGEVECRTVDASESDMLTGLTDGCLGVVVSVGGEGSSQ